MKTQTGSFSLCSKTLSTPSQPGASLQPRLCSCPYSKWLHGQGPCLQLALKHVLMQSVKGVTVEGQRVIWSSISRLQNCNNIVKISAQPTPLFLHPFSLTLFMFANFLLGGGVLLF